MSIFDEYRKKNRKEEEERSVDSSLSSFRDQNDRTKSLFQDKGYAEVTSNARSQINTSDSIRKFRENNIAQRDYEIAEREYMASLPNDAYRDAYTRSKENGGVYVSPYLTKGIEGKEKLKYNNDKWNKLPEATKKKYLEWAQQELETQSKSDKPNLNRTNEALDYAMAIVNETDRYITKVGDMDVQGTYNNKNTFDPDQELQIMYQWMPEEVRDYLYDGMVHVKSEDQELNTREKIEKYLSDNYPEYVIEDLRKYASQAHNAESMYGLMSTADRLLEESPAYATVGSTLQRLATDVVVKPIAGGITLWNKMNGIDDPYETEIQRYAALSDYIGGEVARDAYVPTDAPVFAGKNLSGVYNTSYSIAENVTRMAMAKSIGIGASQVPGLKLSDEVRAAIAKTVASATDLSIVSSSVFNDEYRNAILEGVDPGAATIRAIGHAINESLFEEWSLDKLKIFDAKYVVGSKSGFVKQLLKGAFVEGSEEFATEYANQMFDTLFTYDYSDFKAFKDALDQKTGKTHSEIEAFGLFQKQVMMQAGEAFIGGALSGLVLGATGNYDAYVRGQYYNDYAKNISDTEYQRMLPTVEAMAQAFPKMAEKLEYARQAGGDVMKGVVGEFVSAMNEDIRKSIQQSKTVEDLNTLMDNSLLTTNGVLTQDTINAYNAKLTELGKTPTAEYDTFVRNRDIGASDSIEGLMMPRSETTRNVIKAENEYVTAKYNAEQENTAKNVRRVKETRENLEKQTEFAEDMVARYAVIGKSLDSPELKQYIDALGLERVAKIYSDAKIAAQAETITPVKKNGVVKFADENELHSALGKDSVGHVSALTMNEIRANKDYYATYSYATILGRLTGTNYAFFKSDRTDKQKNGAYDPKTNTAYIDMEAGKSGTARATGGAFSHEFVHEARAKNESLYQGLKEFVKNDLGDSWNDFVKERVDHFKVSEDVAEEEVVAEACQRMLENSEVFKKYAIADYNGAKTLRTRLVEFLNRLRRMVKSVFKGNIDTNVTQAISDLEGLQKEFDHVLEEVIKMPSADEMTKEEAVKQDAMEHGYDFESAGDAVYRYSARFTLSDEQIEEYSKQMSEQLGCTVDEAKEYFKAADSLSSFVLDPLYNKYLDYDPDGRYTAIKKNADYPQGTVDFTNNCRKRTIFTNVFDRLQKAMPNRIFNAVTLADLRETLKKFGYKVACALCFVEDRRQRMGEIGDLYVKALTNSHKNHNDVLMYTNSKKQSYPLLMTQTLKDRYGDRVPFQPGEEIVIKDSYVPTQYDIVTYEGFAKLTEEHPTVALGFESYNNRRGMSSARLIEGRGEYKREILKYTPEQVKRINDLGGLRIFSFSDFEVVHLLDLCQVITDCAAVGLKIQTYTKVPAFAKLIRNTNIKCNRSLIPKGKGWDVDAKGNKYLVYDTTEGIDINDPDFFDSTDSENIGNILVGINKEQIRLAMVDDFVDYIIPFHTNQAKKVLVKKGISLWDNYKKFQTDKTASGSPTMVNIYTEVLDKYNPQNKYQFVDAFLRECKNRKITPRFEEFIDKENGQYKTVTIDGQTYMYTPGYEKFLVDFKLFDKEGNILPQKEVFPAIDMEYAKNLMKAEAENAKEQDKVDDAVVNELIEKYKDKNVKFSQRNTEYMNAIGRGDQETADRLVYETAKERGFTKKLYHGTNAFGFTIVDNDAPGADGFSFWAADTEAMSSTYTKIGRVRNISQNMSDEEVEELREELYNEKSDVMDEDIEKFCRLIAEHFSEWFLGYDGASYVRKVVDDASAETGNGDGVYDKLVDMVGEAYDQYGENFQEEYGEFYEWQEDSEAWEEIENAIIGIEGDKTALDEIENGDMEGGIYQLYANTDNMYELDGKGALWNNLRPEGLPDIGRPYKTRDVAKWTRDNGYDGVIFHNIYDNGQYGRTPLGDVYAFFKPHSQVKSADTVTYDEDGNIIPLSERFNKESEDIRYSSRDTAYLSAVESGDLDTAQKYVDEAAKEAGYTEEYYHGSHEKFNSFDLDKSRFGNSGYGIYLGGRMVAAEFGGDDIIRLYVNPDRIARSDTHSVTTRQFQSALKRLGLSAKDTYKWYVDSTSEYVSKRDDWRLAYDLQDWAKKKKLSPSEILSILQEELNIDGMQNRRELVLWDNKLLKSADPVTYDDNGNVIPLSERFNKENEDIRYSTREAETIPSENRIKDGTAKYFGLTVKYVPNMEAEARNMTSEIWVSDKFFDYDEKIREHILHHEVAHNLSDEMMSEHTGDWNRFASAFIQEKDVPKTSKAYENGQRTYWEGIYGDIGATALSETTTRAITEYLDDASRLKQRSEKAYEEVKRFMDSKGINGYNNIGYENTLVDTKYSSRGTIYKDDSGKKLPKNYQEFLKGTTQTYSEGTMKDFLEIAPNTYEVYFNTEETHKPVYYLRTINPWCASDHIDELDHMPYEERRGLVEKIKASGYDSVDMNVALRVLYTQDGKKLTYGDVYLFDDSNRIETPETAERMARENAVKEYVSNPTDSEGRELSEAQKEFFAYSKVRDENGNLKPMFHGTNKGGFTIFDSRYSDDKLSLFFTDSPSVADSYIYDRMPSEKYEVYLNIKNPLVIDAKDEMWSKIVTSEGVKKDVNRIELEGAADNRLPFVFLSQEQADRFNKEYHISEWRRLLEEARENGTVEWNGNEYDEYEIEDEISELEEETYKEYSRAIRGNLVAINGKDFIEHPENYTWFDFYAMIDELSNGNADRFEDAIGGYKESGMTLHDAVKEWAAEWKEQELEMGQTEAEFEEYLDNFRFMGLPSETFNEGKEVKTTRQIARLAYNDGYDGVIIKNVYDVGANGIKDSSSGLSTVVIAFDSNQIKSVDNLNPTEDNDIRFSARDLANSESEMIVNAMTNDAALADNLGAKQSVTAYAKAYNELQAMEKQSVQYSKELAKASPSEREALYKKLLRLNRAITNKTTELTEMRSQRVLRDVLINEWGKRLDDVAWTNELTYLRTKDALEKKYGGEIKTLKIKSKEQQQAIRNRYEINKRKKNIEKKTKELMNRILHPTEKKHIPSILVNPIVEMLDSIDYWTPAEDRRVTKKSETLKTRFLNFKAAMDEYQKQVNKGAELTEYMFDQDFIDEVQELCNSVRDIKNVNDMTVDEITDLDHILTTLNHLIKRGNDMVVQSHFKTIEEAQGTTAAELIPRKNVSKVAGSVRQRLNAGMADTYAFGEYAGEGARQIVDMLSEANEKRIRQIRTTTEFSKNLLKDTGFQDWKKEEQTFKTENGKEYTMTVPQMMELYLLNKREQARLHIYGKGIRVEDKKGKFTEAFTVTESDVQQVTDYLKQNYPEAVRVADELQKFGATVLTDWGNEASNLMWGISKFTEPNYWQIRSDKSYMKADEKMEQDAPERASMNRLMNLGRTKAVDPKANNEILIGDVFDTFLQTVDDMTSYSSILPAVSDALRWFNSVVELEDGSKIRIRKLMENKLGTDMVKVFTESIKALNGGISHGNNSLEGLVGKLMGNAKAAAVAGNLRVVFQQPTAYTRAYSVMEAKYLNKALLMKPAVKEMQEHSAIGWWKGQGFYSNGLAPSLRKLILDDASVSEKITEKTLILAGLADDLTWGTLWNAAKLKVEDTMKNLEKGSPEYFKAIEKVHSDVINKTQVVDTPLTKALWMRGGGAGKSIVALYTAFMNEPMKTYSMVSTALDKALRGEEGGKKALGIAIVAFGLNAVVNAMAQSIADAARDDDLDKNYWEKYIEKWKSNAFDNVNPLTYIPVIKEAWSITQGFQNNRLDLQALQNSWNALNELTRIAQHKSTKTPFGQVETVAKAVSSWTGIPFTNVMRTFNSIGNLTGWDFLRRKEYTNAQLARNIVVSVEEGDMEDYQKYSEKLLKAVKGDEKKYTNYVSDYLAENSLVIEDYAERYLDDPTVMNDALEELGQYFSDDIIMKAVRKYARSTSDEDIVGTTPLADGNSIYTSKDLNRTLEKGDIATAQEIIDNINAGYAKTGSNTTAKNAVTDYWKPKYLAATGSERDAIAKMLYKLKNKGKQMYSSKDLQKWVSDANKKK